MVNIAEYSRQQKDEEYTKQILENPYQPIVWLGKKYKSLRALLNAKGLPYHTIYKRLKSGKTLTEAIINTEYYNTVNNIIRLHESGQFTMDEISQALNVSNRKVEYTINKYTL